MAEVDTARYQDLTDGAHDLTPLCLGALTLLDNFAVAAAASRTDGASPDAAGDDSTDGLLLAALGLLSLRRTAWRWASHAAGDNATPPRRHPEPPRISQILR